MTAPNRLGSGNGWEEYQRLVLSELRRLNDEIAELRRMVSHHQSQIEVMRARTVTWSGLAAFAGGAMAMLGQLLATGLF